MGSVRFEKGSEEREMFADFYRLCEAIWKPERTDSYWAKSHSEAQAFVKKYEKVVPLSRQLANALLDDLERRMPKK